MSFNHDSIQNLLLKLTIIAFVILLITQSGTGSNHLDLTEANVIDVNYSSLAENSYNFEVTLLHDDDNESPNYADKWVVETLEGIVLGERILTHAHGTVEFTRSAVIDVLDVHKFVVIRGHDQTHGWGGQVIILEISTGIKEWIDQGPDPLGFSDYTRTASEIGKSLTNISSDSNSLPDQSSWLFTTILLFLTLSQKKLRLGIVKRKISID